MILEKVLNVLQATWDATYMAAPWLLFGLFVAGLLYVYLPADMVKRALGGNSPGAIIRAALIGAPLPLCSCGVIPTSLYLRKEGAGRGPVLSFLISTPETNVDSVALTYALMGPVMAVARPLSALFSAFFAGFGERLFGEADPHADSNEDCDCHMCENRSPVRTARDRGGFAGAMKYAGFTLMRDLGAWLILGLFMAGLIGGLVPQNFFREQLGTGLVPMLVIALLATPMYMCATASTPIAAALVAKGVSPGAALVFLLLGPATNMATMTTVGRFLGRRSLVIYLISMILTSIGLGMLLDTFAAESITAAVRSIAQRPEHGSMWFTAISWAATVLLLVLLADSIRFKLMLLWRRIRIKSGAAGTEGASLSASHEHEACCHGQEQAQYPPAEDAGCCGAGPGFDDEAGPEGGGDHAHGRSSPDGPDRGEESHGHDCCNH